ncbi:hypothetical protein BASA50_008081 [Batrachochytrium salamandrivorans]|uniref:Uncharacterized protein n=1 Tax=Batrachochytrium salamandrivorans TaxID=1357716 RepID=A0ABQ8F588_9FUNG|nr:hypothetical protein BASA61_010251 [Batrachochytrium salamandrivorans]KAH6592465.1 hypothetical protein BASA50_008081 [Batrachochytrium salamandrivorans]KAH9274396.1 hypothetical protein BASA83_003026 [Batrachochytrium salamandrivorans]
MQFTTVFIASITAIVTVNAAVLPVVNDNAEQSNVLESRSYNAPTDDTNLEKRSPQYGGGNFQQQNWGNQGWNQGVMPGQNWRNNPILNPREMTGQNWRNNPILNPREMPGQNWRNSPRWSDPRWSQRGTQQWGPGGNQQWGAWGGVGQGAVANRRRY